MKKKILKIFSLIMLFAMTFQVFEPAVVFAVSFEDGNKITLAGSPTINGTSFVYEHGTVTLSKNGILQSTNNVELEAENTVVITLTPETGYEASLHNDSENRDVNLDNNTYTFTVNSAPSKTLLFTPSFNQEGSQNNQEENNDNNNQEENNNDNNNPVVSQVVKFDFRLNGVDFTNIENGETLEVNDNFNLNSIDEFYITKVNINGIDTYAYEDNEYSYDLLDSQGRHIFEINISKTSDNFAKIRIQSHPSDILAKDLKQDVDKYFEFYIPEISIKKSSFRGVEVTTNVMPDSYDFTTWNGVDLTSTSKDNPGTVTVYYGEDTINLSNDDIKKISLVDGKGVPSNVVNIDNTTNKVKVLSNYYNEIPLKVELNDGTVGYINVSRIGIFISSLNKGEKTFYHGAAAEVGENLNVETNNDRIVAVFYHENTKSGNEYKLIVNYTYSDGTTETKEAVFVGDVNNSSGNIIGSDYLLWSGSENMPEKVSVTAVEADALTNNDSFGGATFGSGEGVLWERN